MTTANYVSPQKYSSELSSMDLSVRMRKAALAVKTPALRPVALDMLRKAKGLGMLQSRYASQHHHTPTPAQRQAARREEWKRREGLRLASLAGYNSDEHGTWTRGDTRKIGVIDYVPARDAKPAPYLDLGGEGMALIRIQRTRVYAKSSRWSPSTAETYYVVGRNEAGTYYGHAVTPANTLAEALAWMWQGYHYDIIERQGDIALVRGGKSGYIPDLPTGHRLTATGIEHDTHTTLRLPTRGERVIIARRATAKVFRQSRD